MRRPERILTIFFFFILKFAIIALFIEIVFCFVISLFLSIRKWKMHHQALAGNWRQQGDQNNNRKKIGILIKSHHQQQSQQKNTMTRNANRIWTII